MSDRLDEMEPAIAVVVTFSHQRNLRGYRSRLGLRYPVVTDESRSSYRAYGLRRGRWWRVWSWKTVAEYIKLTRGGLRFQRPKEDTLQLGGDFVIGPDGLLAYAYRSKGPVDRPSVDDLVAAVERLR